MVKIAITKIGTNRDIVLVLMTGLIIMIVGEVVVAVAVVEAGQLEHAAEVEALHWRLNQKIDQEKEKRKM